MAAIKRQIITDAHGEPVGVLLPIEEFALIKDTLEERLRVASEEHQLVQLDQAARDPLFLADLRETMDAFAQADADWWEHDE